MLGGGGVGGGEPTELLVKQLTPLTSTSWFYLSISKISCPGQVIKSVPSPDVIQLYMRYAPCFSVDIFVALIYSA